MKPVPFNLLYTMSELSKIAYSGVDTATSKFSLLGYQTRASFNIKGSEAYLISNTEHWVLVFRGTQFTKIDDVKAALSLFRTHEGAGKVHSGAKNQVDKIWNKVQLALKDCTLPLIITGHSLGAAEATIAASRLQNKYDVSMCTFGSPRVGNRAFVNALNVQHYRVRNANDIVTKLPFFLYKHHGQLVFLDQNGKHVKGSWWQLLKVNIIAHFNVFIKGEIFSSLHDHAIRRYIKKLNNLTS